MNDENSQKPKVVVSCSADSDLKTITTKSSTTISCVKVSKPRELVSTENGNPKSEIENENKYIKITKEISEKIYKALKQRGFSLSEISLKVGFEFKDYPYKDHFVSLGDLNRLKSLIIEELGSNGLVELFGINDIPHKNFIKSQEEITLKYNPLTSEFISIMLGDGHLNEKGDVVQVTLNRVDDPEYVKYVFNLIKEIFPMFNIQIYGASYYCSKCNNTHTKNDSIYLDHLNYSFIERGVAEDKTIQLQLNTASAHYALTQLGLIPGNKVQNRVKVPDVIFESDKLLKIKSLRGLFDTDGTIYVHASFNKKYQKIYPTLTIKFTNGSRPLVESFARLCSDLDIHTGEVTGPYKANQMHDYYQFNITNKRDVKTFIDLINPQKLKEPFRLFYLGCQLLYLSYPTNIIEQINHRIFNDYPKESDRKYSNEFSIYLRELCQEIFLDNKITEILGFKFTGKISEDMVLEAIYKNLLYAQKGIEGSRINKHTFKDFLKYYREFPNEEISFYYAHFPEANEATLRGYKTRARRLISEESLDDMPEE